MLFQEKFTKVSRQDKTEKKGTTYKFSTLKFDGNLPNSLNTAVSKVPYPIVLLLQETSIEFAQHYQ